MKVEEYAEEVVGNFMKDIEERVFLSIEHDNDSMRKYVETVNRFGQNKVDKTIIRKIGERLGPKAER
ncbi:MAG: hypothetical protein FWD94_07635 [Treponema sp.]|nr:hypothetical protein [Treponema sp.]